MGELTLNEPSIAVCKSMRVAGIRQSHLSSESQRLISRQWSRLRPYLDGLHNQIGHASYGLVCKSGSEQESDYMCAVEVEDFSELPPELDRMQIPERKYAVFSHEGHAGDVEKFRQSVLQHWVPESGYSVADAPEIERFEGDFNPASDEGKVEIWIPLNA